MYVKRHKKNEGKAYVCVDDRLYTEERLHYKQKDVFSMKKESNKFIEIIIKFVCIGVLLRNDFVLL